MSSQILLAFLRDSYGQVNGFIKNGIEEAKWFWKDDPADREMHEFVSILLNLTVILINTAKITAVIYRHWPHFQPGVSKLLHNE